MFSNNITHIYVYNNKRHYTSLLLSWIVHSISYPLYLCLVCFTSNINIKLTIWVIQKRVANGNNSPKSFNNISRNDKNPPSSSLKSFFETILLIKITCRTPKGKIDFTLEPKSWILFKLSSAKNCVIRFRRKLVFKLCSVLYFWSKKK